MCECVKSCPNCGFDLSALKAFNFGALTIISGALVLWHGAPIALSQTEILLVSLLARANGARVTLTAMCEAIGYDREGPASLISSHLAHIRAKFRTVDPFFNQIQRGTGQGADGTAWWVIDEPLLDQLRATPECQRRIHRLLLLHPRASLHELADEAGLKHNSVWNHIKRLEHRGLVMRGANYRRGWIAAGTLELHRRLTQP